MIQIADLSWGDQASTLPQKPGDVIAHRGASSVFSIFNLSSALPSHDHHLYTAHRLTLILSIY